MFGELGEEPPILALSLIYPGWKGFIPNCCPHWSLQGSSNTPNSDGQGYWYRSAEAIVAAQSERSQTSVEDPQGIFFAKNNNRPNSEKKVPK